MNRKDALGAHLWDSGKYWLIRKSQWLDSMKRGLRLRGVTHADRLFVYLARETGRPVLAYWVKEKPGGLVKAFITLVSLSTLPDMCPAAMPTVEYLTARLKPARIQAQEGLRALWEEEWAEKETLRQEHEAKQEWLKFVNKKDPDLARRVKMGMLPVSFTNTGATQERLARIFSALAKRPSIIKG